MQVYGRDSVVFAEERKKLDDAFMALPPPEPSIQRSYGSYGGNRKTLKSMSAYYSSSGPCFSGDCTVSLSGGGTVCVEELRRGMEIQTLKGARKVAVVVRTAIPSGEALLCRIGDLKVTPWHPILSAEAWAFPADIAKPELVPCEAVYSLLLLPVAEQDALDAHSVCVSGVWCVTLGHGLTSVGAKDVRAHAFLGDYEKVLRSLSRLDGFGDDDGVVRCGGTSRDPVDGTICGFSGEESMEQVSAMGALHEGIYV